MRASAEEHQIDCSKIRFSIEIDTEDDGRSIAEAPGFPGVMAYGANHAEALVKCLALVFRVIADRMDPPKGGERRSPEPPLPLPISSSICAEVETLVSESDVCILSRLARLDPSLELWRQAAIAMLKGEARGRTERLAATSKALRALEPVVTDRGDAYG